MLLGQIGLAQQQHKSIMQEQLQYYDSLENAGVDFYQKIRPKQKSNVYDGCSLNKRVYGWYPYWEGSVYQNFEWSLISDLSYFAYEVDPSTGNATSTHGWETAAVVDEALAHGVNVTLTVTLFSNHSTFLNSQTARQTLINNLIQLVSARGANGINVDFEGVSSSLKSQFNDFLVQLADAFHSQLPGSEVSVALYAVDWGDVFDEALLNDHLDLFIIMGYDYYYSGSSTAGPTDPLYSFTSGSVLNLSKSINYYLNEGITPEKLLLGLPYYGFDYPTNSSSLYASTTGSGSAKIFSTVKDNVYGYYSSANNHFDYNSYSNYYVYNNGNWHQCFINNQATMEKRLSLINEYNIGGMGIWALGYDDGYMDYWNAIANRFSNCSTLCTDTIFDNGGPSRDYYDNTDYTFTINPSSNAQGLRITFQSLNLEAGYDSLWIYDGPSDNYQVLAALSGTSIPSPILTSSNSATVRFHSDGATTAAGWQFTWECLTDNVPPEVNINSPDWVSSDFSVNITSSDNDNIAGDYYCYANKNPDKVWQSPADSGMFWDSFDYDNLPVSTWHQVEGNWYVTSSHTLKQDDENLSNTNIYIPLLQTHGKDFIIDWDMKIGGTGNNRRAGLHFFIDHPDSSNRDNNYMVYFRVDQNKVQVYKYINNSYNLMRDDDCNVNADTWYNYKIKFEPATGKITVYQNDVQVSSWTDTSPFQIGDYLSLRTGNAVVEYDNIKVLVSREEDNYDFTASYDSSSIIRYENNSPLSPAFVIDAISQDAFGNFAEATKFVNVDFSNPIFSGPVRDGTASDIDSLYDNNFIAANWDEAIDFNDSIAEYFVAVGTQPGSDDVIAWHSNGAETMFDTSGISLTFGQTYYTSVYCKNMAGLYSDTITSDGVIVTMPGEVPTASFYTSDSLICVGDSIHFISTSSYAAGYLWLFEGGSPYFSLEQNPTVVYNGQGLFDVTLIVTNELGSDTLQVENLINVEGKPVADFEGDPTEGMQPLTVYFTNTSLNSYNYMWQFGDGNVSSETNPVHTYNVVGSYDVTLIAGNNSCPSDTMQKSDYISVITDVTVEESFNTEVYPVPAKDFLMIKTKNPAVKSLVLYDDTGKEVKSVNNFSGYKYLSVKDLSSGVYFLKLLDADKKIISVFKIIKQ